MTHDTHPQQRRRALLDDLRRTRDATLRALEAAERDPCAGDTTFLQIALRQAEHEIELAEAAEMERAA